MDPQRLRQHRYLILLLVLITALVLQMGRAEYAYFRESALSVALVMVFLIVLDRRSHRFLSISAGLVVILSLWVLRIIPDLQRRMLEMALHIGTFIFLVIAVGVILRHLFERRAVSIDDLLGTLCGYLMAAMAFTNVYGAIELLSPGAFSINTPIASLLANWYQRESLFTYFSLTTLTTMGYGDITPVAPAARSAAVLQAVFGQFYIAVVVAQLVGSKLTEAGGPSGGHRE
jgi:Ion channel